MKDDVRLYDGDRLLSLGAEAGDTWTERIRSLPTALLERVAAAGQTPFTEHELADVNCFPALRIVADELIHRHGRPALERARATGAQVRAARRWLGIAPVETNYGRTS